MVLLLHRAALVLDIEILEVDLAVMDLEHVALVLLSAMEFNFRAKLALET